MSTPLLILFTAGIILFLIFVLREARRLAGFLLAFGGLIVAGVVAYALVTQASATRQVARIAEVQAMTGAGMTLIISLLLLLLGILIVAGVLIVGLLWWKERQRRQRMLEFLWLNQMYGAFTGSRSGASHSLPQGAPVIIVPAGYPPILGGSGLYIPPEILTQLQEPNDPLAGLLPE
jgi:hypothetical protein